MDWTSIIGRARPREQDALRILCIVHQLGAPVDVAGFHKAVVGESRLQYLDHLVRRPTDLAYVLVDQFARRRELRGRRTGLMRRIRKLAPPVERRQHRFRLASWQRWDDVMAMVGSRGLLRAEAAGEGLRYLLTDGGARLLDERVYPSEKAFAPCLDSCRLIGEFLPDSAQVPWRQLFQEIAGRLAKLQREEQISPADDLLSLFFEKTFGESL